jgi:hypothetical protein
MLPNGCSHGQEISYHGFRGRTTGQKGFQTFPTGIKNASWIGGAKCTTPCDVWLLDRLMVRPMADLNPKPGLSSGRRLGMGRHGARARISEHAGAAGTQPSVRP